MIIDRLRLNSHNLFKFGLLVKGIDGVLGMMGGFVVLFIGTGTIIKVFNIVTRYELTEDPNDFIANSLIRFSANLSLDTKIFIAFYLIGYSLVKVVLVVGLWKNKKWAYPTAIIVMMLFVVYQLFGYYHTHSVSLAIFTIIDILIIYLIYTEYKR